MTKIIHAYGSEKELNKQTWCRTPIIDLPHLAIKIADVKTVKNSPVLWIRNFSFLIRIRLFYEFRIRLRILLSNSSGLGTDLFPDGI
jgi:hypothetical protein